MIKKIIAYLKKDWEDAGGWRFIKIWTFSLGVCIWFLIVTFASFHVYGWI